MHDVKALVASTSVLTGLIARLGAATLCPLAQGLALLPITDTVAREIAATQTSAEREHALVPDIAGGLASLAKQLSHTGPVAYISTEYFGGAGGQDAIVWEEARVILQLSSEGVEWPNSPVSQALRAIGIKAEDGKDEFDTVGLGTHRSTDRWASAHGASS